MYEHCTVKMLHPASYSEQIKHFSLMMQALLAISLVNQSMLRYEPAQSLACTYVTVHTSQPWTHPSQPRHPPTPTQLDLHIPLTLFIAMSTSHTPSPPPDSAFSPLLLSLAPLLSAFTSGTLASISLITIPAVITSPTPLTLLTTFHSALNSGVRVCPPLAVLSSLAHLTNSYYYYHYAGAGGGSSGAAKLSIAAALATLGIVPFTILVMQGVNEKLFSLERAELEMEKRAGGGRGREVQRETRDLVRRWARLNLVRAVFPALGAVLRVLAAR